MMTPADRPARCSVRVRTLWLRAAGFLCTLATILAAAPAAAQVVSHTFEDGTTQGWVARGPVSLASTTEVAQGGVASLRTTGRTSTWNGPALDLRSRLAPNATYQISGWVRLVAGQPASNLKFTVERTPVGGSATYTQVNAAAAVTDAAWVYLQGNYTLPAGDQTAVTLYLESDSPTAAYHLDTFTITALTVASCPEPHDQSGLYTDFEAGTSGGWNSRGSAVLAATTDAAYSGARSLSVTGRTASWQGPTINTLCKLHKGSKYLISVWVRLLPGQPASQVRMTLEARLSGATSYLPVIGNTNVTDGAWVNLSTEYTFTADVDQLQLYLETASGTASFYLDDFLVVNIPVKPVQTDIPSLKDVLAADFPLGTATDPSGLVGVQRDLLLKHFSMLTAGNAMKWDALRPNEATFRFTDADALANFARAHGLRMRGHTLLWHAQTPAWVFRDAAGNPLVAGNPDHRALLLERLRTHIHTVVPRYADVVESWDVVNEVIDPAAPGGLRVSPWLQIIGPDYIDWAFHYAAEVAGEAGLYINDYSTESPAKRAALQAVVQGLLDRGVPVDGVGHQAHINIEWPALSDIRATVETFAAMGLDNKITEFDMSVYTNSTSTTPVSADTLTRQGYRYRDVFMLYRELAPMISSFTIWGLGDDTSWLKTFPITRDDKPLPFDEELQAKPAYWGIVDPTQLPVLPKAWTITQGNARINGAEEPFWEALAPQPLTTSEFDGSWATFRAVWDDATVFILVEVDDATRCASGDTVDIFVGDARYTFSGFGRKKPNGADGMLLPRHGGYQLKAAIPAGAVLAAGSRLAFDVRVTDSATGDQLSWSDTRHTQESDRSKFGTLSLIPRKQIVSVSRGTPVIDGVVDRAWKSARPFTTQTFVLGSSGATARVRTLWDDGHLYLLAEVQDPLLSTASANPWEQDSIEIFVDANNAQTSAYEADDAQFRVNFLNERSFGGAASEARIVSATRLVPGGYIVEVAIAVDGLADDGGRGCRRDASFIGFDIQVNDDGLGDGVRSSVATWNDTSGNAYLDPSQFGALRLLRSGHTPRH